MRILFAVIIALLSLPLHAKDVVFHEFKLENGLRVVVAPMPNSPAISHNLLFFAGSADDALGSSGVAHYLEHVLFKGTPTVPEGEYSKIIERLGGDYNAFTSTDMTGYYVTIGKQHIAKVMELEADRMQHLAPSQEAYSKEREVVLEERRLRTDNNPAALLYEAMNVALYRHHPYRIPIIGWSHEINQLGEVPAKAFLAKHYTPANAVLVLVGDVSKEQAETLTKKHYGAWNGAPKPARQWTSEPVRQVSQTVSLHHETVTVPKINIAYIAPSLATAGNPNEVMPLLLAEELLGNPRTGILYERLVKQQKLATEVSISYSPFSLGMSQVNVSLVPAQNVALDALKTAYEQVIADVVAEKIFKDDVEVRRVMQRAKNQMKAETIFAQDSVQGMGFILAQLIMIGQSPEWFNHWSGYVDAVTYPQIIASVKDTIIPDYAVTGYLLPVAKKEEKPSPPQEGKHE
jgi:zinc protease